MQVLFSLHVSSSDWAVLQCLGPVPAGPTLGLPVWLLCLRDVAVWAALSTLPRVAYLSARPKHGVRWFLAFSRKSRPGLGTKPVNPDHYSGCGRWGHAAHARCPREGLVLIPSPQRGWAAVSTCQRALTWGLSWSECTCGGEAAHHGGTDGLLPAQAGASAPTGKPPSEMVPGKAGFQNTHQHLAG